MQHLYRTTLGSLRHSRAIGGLLITVSDYAASSYTPRHEHTNAYLCLVSRGGYRQSAGGRTHECLQGLLLVHPECHCHADHYSPSGARCLNIHLDHALGDDHSISRLLGDHRHLQLRDAARLRHRIERELIATDAASGLALQAAILELIAQACRETEPHSQQEPAWLARVRERLHDDQANVPTLGELARLAGVHPAHLARTFQQLHGVSVGEHQRRLRVERACKALTGTSLPIATIAADTGFNDQSHFARVFHRVTGETPHAWRQRMQNPY